MFPDAGSANDFKGEVEYNSSFYGLTLPPSGLGTVPPPYESSTFRSSIETRRSTGPVENYYAATDVVKVILNNINIKYKYYKLRLFEQTFFGMRFFETFFKFIGIINTK